MLKSIMLMNETVEIMAKIIKHDRLFALPTIATLFDFACEMMDLDKEESLQEFTTMIRNVNEREGPGFSYDHISS